jgi:hypothetical protein
MSAKHSGVKSGPASWLAVNIDFSSLVDSFLNDDVRIDGNQSSTSHEQAAFPPHKLFFLSIFFSLTVCLSLTLGQRGS